MATSIISSNTDGDLQEATGIEIPPFPHASSGIDSEHSKDSGTVGENSSATHWEAGHGSASGSGSSTPSYGEDIAADMESAPSTPNPTLTSTPRFPGASSIASEISSIQDGSLIVRLSRSSSFETSSNLSLLSSGQGTSSSTLSGTQADTVLNHEEIEVPVLSYETMESQARFTVYKIQVKRSQEENWFIFRRYTDFVRLNKKLRSLFPHFRLALPPKKWFGDNFDKNFLEDRMLGLQAFLNNIVGHRDVCNSKPVRQFLCFDDPPGAHESLEESRAMCESLEEYSYTLRRELQDRDTKITLLEEEISLQRAEIESLHTSLRLERSFHAKRSSPGSQYSECSLPEQDQVSELSPSHCIKTVTASSSAPSSANSQLDAMFPLDKMLPMLGLEDVGCPVEPGGTLQGEEDQGPEGSSPNGEDDRILVT